MPLQPTKDPVTAAALDAFVRASGEPRADVSGEWPVYHGRQGQSYLVPSLRLRVEVRVTMGLHAACTWGAASSIPLDGTDLVVAARREGARMGEAYLRDRKPEAYTAQAP